MASLRPGSPGRPSGPAGRTAARAAARRTAAKAPVPPPAPSRTGFTTRAAVLGLVLCAMALSAAVPVREFLAQRGDIRRVEEAQVEQRARIAALEVRKQQLEDPAHVAQVARERLHYVLPGETAYVVLRPGETPEEQRTAKEREASKDPWYSQVWGSVREADAAP